MNQSETGALNVVNEFARLSSFPRKVHLHRQLNERSRNEVFLTSLRSSQESSRQRSGIPAWLPKVLESELWRVCILQTSREYEKYSLPCTLSQKHATGLLVPIERFENSPHLLQSITGESSCIMYLGQ